MNRYESLFLQLDHSRTMLNTRALAAYHGIVETACSNCEQTRSKVVSHRRDEDVC